MDTLKKITKAAADTKYRVLAHDIPVLCAVSLLKDDASASQIVLMLTMARGKMISLTQIAPVLKELTNWGCLEHIDAVSDHTGRPIIRYKLTKRGEQVLELGTQLLTILAKPSKTKNKVA
jgi:DNA-binding PadR family transcriptional regulator